MKNCFGGAGGAISFGSLCSGMKLEIRNEMLNHNLVKLYVHCEINETIEMTFKIETKLDT